LRSSSVYLLDFFYVLVGAMHDKPLALLTPGIVSGIVHSPGFKLSVMIILIPGLRSRNFL